MSTGKLLDATERTASVLREQAYRYTLAYLEGGNAALGSYRDKKKPRFIADELEALLENSPYVLEYRPELHRYLSEFPNGGLEGAEDFLYWSQYDYGKPVLRVSHVTMYPTEDGNNGSAIITGKQLWYTHFFVTGLDIYALVRDTKSEGEAFYLVVLVRMRTDGVGGMFGNLLKNQAVKSVLENVQGYLTTSKAAIERYYRDQLRRRDELRRRDQLRRTR